jgi:carboxypeptidase Taq
MLSRRPLLQCGSVNGDLLELRERLAEMSDLRRVRLLLSWDQRVTMPPGGAEARANAVATVGRIEHARFVDDEIGRLLERLRPYEESLDFDSDDASLIRVARRDWEKARREPPDLRAERLRAASLANAVWIEARATSDFSLFLPALERNLDVCKRYAECFEWEDSPYTPLLDDFEPFMTTTDVAEIFDVLRAALAEIVRDAPEVDASFFDQQFDPERQLAFAKRLVGTVGLDEGAWRLDTSAHPFCTWFSRRDVRMTTRFMDTGLRALWSTLHESGHALYAHGITTSLERTPLAGSPSFGLNESQSRTWENLVGRSRGFWTHWYDPLQATFPEKLGDVDLDRFLAAVNRVQPTALRGRADETTYGLHIILRFELERQLVEETLTPRDVPEAWNERIYELLGVEVPDDAHGVLQDIHWSACQIGYFPTYQLGNVMSLQIWAVAREAIPDLDAQLEAGELHELSAWLRDNLYSLGRKFTPRETLERVTGSPEIDPEPLLAYLREKASALAA